MRRNERDEKEVERGARERERGREASSFSLCFLLRFSFVSFVIPFSMACSCNFGREKERKSERVSACLFFKKGWRKGERGEII